MKIKNKLGLIIIIILIIFGIFVTNFLNYSLNIDINEGFKHYYELNTKISPATYTTPILIDGDATGKGAQNWTWALNQGYCTGTGDSGSPYIIKNDIFQSGSNLTIIDSNEDYFKIENCTFYYTDNVGIKLNNVSKGIIARNNFSYFIGYAIEIDECNELIILDNDFDIINRIGIHVKNSVKINISENSMIETYSGYPFYRNGIELYKTNYSYVINNDISGIDYDDAAGINIVESHYNVIMNNKVYDTEEYSGWIHHGISLTKSYENNISQNVIYNTDNGILLSNIKEKNRIYNNTIHDSNSAIKLDGCEFNLIIDNHAYSNTFGIHLRYSDNNTVSKNKVSDNQEGIALFESEENDIIENNVRKSNGTGWGVGSGISMEQNSDNNYVSLNLIEDNDYGIFIWGGRDNEIIKNTIQMNGIGIWLYQCYEENEISNNVIDSNDVGISLQTSDYTFISYNNITNSGTGITIEGDTYVFNGNNTIFKNIISYCNYTGIYLTLTNDNQIFENIISYNDIGVHFFIANYNNISANFFFCNTNHTVSEDCMNYFNDNIFEECPPEDDDGNGDGDGNGMAIPGYYPLAYISVIIIGVSVYVNFLKKKIKIK